MEKVEDLPGKYIILSHGKVYYELKGNENDPLIVLVHGFSSPSYVWDFNYYSLVDAGYRVLRYDLYGRGFSAKPKIRYDENLFVDQLWELLNHLHISESSESAVTLMGLSMGGAICMFFTDCHPKLVNRIILVDPAGFRWNKRVYPLFLKISFINHLLFSKYGKTAIIRKQQHYLQTFGREKEYLPKFSAQFETYGYKNALLDTMLHFPMQSAPDVYYRVGKLNFPKLLLWGTKDETIPFAINEKVRQALLDVEFHAIQGAGHMSQFDHFEEVNQILLDFLHRTD